MASMQTLSCLCKRRLEWGYPEAIDTEGLSQHQTKHLEQWRFFRLHIKMQQRDVACWMWLLASFLGYPRILDLPLMTRLQCKQITLILSPLAVLFMQCVHTCTCFLYVWNSGAFAEDMRVKVNSEPDLPEKFELCLQYWFGNSHLVKGHILYQPWGRTQIKPRTSVLKCPTPSHWFLWQPENMCTFVSQQVPECFLLPIWLAQTLEIMIGCPN